MVANMIHPTYMPFSREQLLSHFNDERHLDYFVTSAIRYIEFTERFGAMFTGMPITDEVRLNRQIEKDERFWTTCTLKSVFDAGQFAGILRAGFGESPSLPGFASWEQCVGERGDQTLRFEVAVPSPASYRQSLRSRFLEGGRSPHLIPYVVDAGQGRTQYEGATKVDAVFANTKTGFSVLFESKVLSDISCEVTFDSQRNQIARNIDIMVDEGGNAILSARPSMRLLCLLTPQCFYEKPSTRYYGLLYWLYKRQPEVLVEHFPHRDPAALVDVPSRLGWLSFEKCMEIVPNCCPWLLHPGEN